MWWSRVWRNEATRWWRFLQPVRTWRRHVAPSLRATHARGCALGICRERERLPVYSTAVMPCSAVLLLPIALRALLLCGGVSVAHARPRRLACGSGPRYHNWRIEMWEALSDRTVRLTICAPTQASKAAAPLQLLPAGSSQALPAAAARGTAGTAAAAAAAAAAASTGGAAGPAGTTPSGGSLPRRGAHTLEAAAGGGAEAGGGNPRSGSQRGAACVEAADGVSAPSCVTTTS